jgi:hypothetical protein
MITRTLRHLVMLDAAGALPEADRIRLEDLLAAASEAVRLEMSAIYESAASLPAGLALDTPSQELRARILAHAARQPR